MREIDINPLLAGPDQVIALDGAGVLLAEEGSPGRTLAILPYPNQYTAPFHTADGGEVTVRVIRPEDEPLIVEHHAQLSEQSIRRRFFGRSGTCRGTGSSACATSITTAKWHWWLWRGLDRATYSRRVRDSCEPETGAAEFAVVVSDPNQGRGLGHHLMERLIAESAGSRRKAAKGAGAAGEPADAGVVTASQVRDRIDGRPDDGRSGVGVVISLAIRVSTVAASCSASVVNSDS